MNQLPGMVSYQISSLSMMEMIMEIKTVSILSLLGIPGWMIIVQDQIHPFANPVLLLVHVPSMVCLIHVDQLSRENPIVAQI